MKLELPPDQYFEQLAKFPTSGSAIIRNENNEFLIVKQTYKDGWHFSGGGSDKNEKPSDTIIREVKEELCIDIKVNKCICVDFITNPPFSRINFMFDCGILKKEDIDKIKIDTDEISELKFVKPKEMFELLSEASKKRIFNSIDNINTGNCTYLENGVIF